MKIPSVRPHFEQTTKQDLKSGEGNLLARISYAQRVEKLRNYKTQFQRIFIPK